MAQINNKSIKKHVSIDSLHLISFAETSYMPFLTLMG